MALIKSAVFGFFIALMGCYHGFRTSGGAAGVGRATTNAVVSHLHPDPALEPAHHGDRVRMSKIVLQDLTKAFGSNKVLDGVTLTVEPGESVAIIGQSGSGKSVMLKCILGLIRPDGGSIKLDGVEIAGIRGRELDQMRSKFGMLFQGGALFDSLPVWRNVTFALTQGRLDRQSGCA